MSNKFIETFLNSLQKEQKSDIDQTSEILASYSPKILAKLGYSIINLVISQIKIGLAGKTSIELSQRFETNEDISNGFKNGDIVRVCKYGDDKLKKKLKGSSKKGDQEQDDGEEYHDIEGIVVKITTKSILVSINEDSTESVEKLLQDDDDIYLLKLTNSITYKRMESTLRKLLEFQNTDKSELIQLLLNEIPYKPPSTTTDITFINQGLNESQKTAIKFSVDSNISIIHGPPGTGKTFTLIEIIQQLLRTGKSKRILICGASNICVDTILERLVNVADGGVLNKSELLRIGHPSRLLSSIQATSLENILYSNGSDNDSNIILKELQMDINQNLNVKLKKTKSWKERKEIYKDVKDMRKDLKFREKKYIKEIIMGSKVVVSTLHGSGNKELVDCYKDYSGSGASKPEIFDTLIIDEVSQSLEPQCWIPLIAHHGIKKLIIAGDNKQLSPTIKSEDSKVKHVLEYTLFDRLDKVYGDQFINLLEVQYRMNGKIMEFSSKELYKGRLKCGGGCDDIVLADLITAEGIEKSLEGLDIEEDDILCEPLVLYDTQGSDFPEQEEDSTILQPSKFNEMEVLVVLKHLEILIEKGVKYEDIGIISPYGAQVSRLKKAVDDKFYNGQTKAKVDDKTFKKSKVKEKKTKKKKLDEEKQENSKIEISTVDGFQGREKQVIIISLVRSNPQGDIGFLKDFKRLNVGITRAKRQLCIVGNTETLSRSKNSFLKRLVEYFEHNSLLIYPDLTELL